MMYVVEIESGVWLADWEGDPGRTLKIGNAKRFETYEQAKGAAINASLHRPLRKWGIEQVEEQG